MYGRNAQILLVIAVTLLTAACASEEGGGSTPPGHAATPAYLNLDPAVKFVGMENCSECHLGLYTTFTQTGMGRAFYEMEADVVVEDFHDQNEVVVDDSGLRYRMFERDGKYWQRQYVVDDQGREIVGEERELIWVVGSNNHSRSYLTVTDDKTFQAPICWYPQAEKWDLCPGYEFKNEHFGREVSTSCLFCHNGRMELVEGERNQFKKPFPEGIGCERCHGPGELHVAKWKGGAEPTGEVDLTIVNPRRLPQRERIDVCFQCHFGDARATARVGVYGEDLNEFRPGMKLASKTIAYVYDQQTQVEFGISSQGDRLIQSTCYKESGGKIECLTCHDPHVSVYNESRPADHFRKKCMSCHDVDACGESFDVRAGTTPQDDCVQCHMRTAEPDDQRYTEFTDHWIRKNIEFDERDHRTDFTANVAFPEDVAHLSTGERYYYQGRAMFLLAQDAPKSRWVEMWIDAEKEFRNALDAGYENDDVWFFLGKTLFFLGRKTEAADCWENTIRHNADHHDGLFALAGLQLEKGNPQRAADLLKRILDRDPDDTMSMSEYGRALFALGRPAEALDWFSRAAGHEPWDPTLQVNLGMTLAATGNMDRAAQAGVRAVSLDPERPEAWSLFHNSMRELGRHDRAAVGRWYAERLELIRASAPDKGPAPSM